MLREEVTNRIVLEEFRGEGGLPNPNAQKNPNNENNPPNEQPNNTPIIALNENGGKLLFDDNVFDVDFMEEETSENEHDETGDDINNNNINVIAGTLQPTEIAEIMGIINNAQDHGMLEDPEVKKYLQDSPEGDILVAYSAIVGDILHAMRRTRVSTKHCHKKGYVVALREAFLAWSPNELRHVQEVLKQNGYSDEEIKAREYYNVKWYARRVPRVALPPHKLYHRVRAVYTTFGIKRDNITNLPLFNKNAWKKANGVLSEILKGYYTDPPTETFYHYKTTLSGEVVCDNLGLKLITCTRGTNVVENVHKHLQAPFGSTSCGFEMSDCVLAEYRHRHNHRASIRNRKNFPHIGHYDTWLVDALQESVYKVHGALLYSGWTNSTDYLRTNEEFGIVPLADVELTEAINNLQIGEDTLRKLPRDLKYLAKRTNLKLPVLPWHGAAEYKLYPILVLNEKDNQARLDTKIAYSILPHVDGELIFPKHPVYNRLYNNVFTRNGRIRSAAKEVREQVEQLKMINRNNLLEEEIQKENVNEQKEEESDNKGCDNDLVCMGINMDTADEDVITRDDVVLPTVTNNYLSWTPIYPRGIEGPIGQMTTAVIPLVAGFRTQIRPHPEEIVDKIPRKKRGRDKKTRAQRKCKRCHDTTCSAAKPGKGKKICTAVTDINGNELL
jgi:hypothetical protein